MATIIGDGIQPQKQWLYRGCLPGMYEWDWIDLTSNCLGYTLLRFPDPHLDHWMTAVTKHIPYANGAGICTNKTAPVFLSPSCVYQHHGSHMGIFPPGSLGIYRNGSL
jgi:hypothetical protein